jgi:hypothetical protein
MQRQPDLSNMSVHERPVDCKSCCKGHLAHLQGCYAGTNPKLSANWTDAAGTLPRLGGARRDHLASPVIQASRRHISNEQMMKEDSGLGSGRTLMRNNLEKIATLSVTTDELGEQRAVLEAAERKLTGMEQRRVKILEKIAGLRQRLAEARNLHRDRDTAQTKHALMSLTKRLDSAMQQRDSVLFDYRELKLLVRDQHSLYSSLVKKEEARQKAVAKFLKEWERRYDRETRMKEKNVRKRGHLSEM